MISGMRGHRARAGGVDRVLRQQVDAVGQPVGQRGRGRGALQLQPARGAAQLPLRKGLDLGGAHAEPLQEVVRALRPQLAVGDQRQRGTLRDRAAEQPVGGRAGQQREHGRPAGGLAEHRHPVGVAAERGDVVPDPAQRGQLVAQREVVVEPVAEVAELESAENPYPVGDVDDHDVPVGGQPRPVVELELARAEHECAAGNPHHHRQGGAGVGRPHRQRQARLVANLRIVAAAADERLALRWQRSVLDGIAHPRPRLQRARAPGTAVRRPVARRTARRARPRRPPSVVPRRSPELVCTTVECPATTATPES